MGRGLVNHAVYSKDKMAQMTFGMQGLAYQSSIYGPAGRLLGLGLFFLFLLGTGGCQVRSIPERAALADQGEMYVYVQPFPQQANRLRFVLQGLTALRDDGTEFPLVSRLSELSCQAVPRQTLLATGQLPPGHYSGFVVQARSAFLQDEEGESAMLVSETPRRLDFPFRIDRKKPSLVQMSFDYGLSLQDSVKFSPVFTVVTPERPPVGVIGYVANADSNDITVFDKKSRQVVGVLATGAGPSGIAFDAKHQRAYVTLAREDVVEVIDILAGDTLDRIRLQSGDRPMEPAITPSGNQLLVANSGSNTVSLVDPLSFMEVARLPVGNAPRSVMIDRAGKRAYSFNSMSGTVTVIDLARSAVVATVPTGGEPIRGAISRANDRLFVIHRGSPYLSVVNLATLEVTRVFVGQGMSAVKVDTRTDLLYLAKGTLGIYDPLALYPLDSMSIGSTIAYMTIDGDENNLYLVLPEKGQVAVYNLDSKLRVTTLDTGEGPCWLNLMGER
jgi:YVTN family beta-propeller protein